MDHAALIPVNILFDTGLVTEECMTGEIPLAEVFGNHLMCWVSLSH